MGVDYYLPLYQIIYFKLPIWFIGRLKRVVLSILNHIKLITNTIGLLNANYFPIFVIHSLLLYFISLFTCKWYVSNEPLAKEIYDLPRLSRKDTSLFSSGWEYWQSIYENIYRLFVHQNKTFVNIFQRDKFKINLQLERNCFGKEMVIWLWFLRLFTNLILNNWIILWCNMCWMNQHNDLRFYIIQLQHSYLMNSESS